MVEGTDPIVTEISIEKLVYGGEGLARLNGKVVLAPYVLPGETVKLRPRQESAKLVRALPVEIVQASEHRVEAPCAHYRRCGGCHYQHATYAYQLEQKRAILGEVLARIGRLRRAGRIEVPEIETVAGPEWGYRNRIQLHIADGRIGYHQAGSHTLCPVRECPVASPKLVEALAALRQMLPQPRFPRMVRAVELFTDEERVQINVRETDGRHVARTFFEWCAARIPGADATTIDYHAADEVYRVSPRSFFQVNRFLVDRLVEAALAGARGGAAVDLYAGVGLFSLALARRGARVSAVESSGSAYGDLVYNAQRAGLVLVAQRTSAEAYLESLDAPPEFVLADPPRAGLGKGVVAQLVRLRPPRLTIVSCDPATLARDMAALVGAGYRIVGMTLVDLFPQTYHIETVAHLSR